MGRQTPLHDFSPTAHVPQSPPTRPALPPPVEVVALLALELFEPLDATLVELLELEVEAVELLEPTLLELLELKVEAVELLEPTLVELLELKVEAVDEVDPPAPP